MFSFPQVTGARRVILKCDPALEAPTQIDPSEDGEMAYVKALAAFDATYAEYERTGDERLLPVRQGDAATVFMIAPLDAPQRGHVIDVTRGALLSSGELHVRVGSASVETIAYGVHDVINLSVAGQPMKVTRVRGEFGYRLSTDVLDILCRNDALRSEITRHISRITQLSPEAAKSTQG